MEAEPEGVTTAEEAEGVKDCETAVGEEEEEDAAAGTTPLSLISVSPLNERTKTN